MATTVKIRRSGTATATPSALEHGELAINYADKVLYFKDASNVITSFTFQSYALASHTHAASDITSGTLDAARLPLATTGAAGAVIVGTGLGVSSGTVSVTYGTGSGTACQGNDSRLSDTRTPTDGTVTTAKIANDAVTYAKIQNVSATDRLLGRSSSGAGDVEEITCTAFGRSLIDDSSAADARTTLSVQPTASPTFTGTLTAATCSFSGTCTVTSPLVLTGTVAGNVRQLRMQTSGSTRWEVGPGFDAESGSNVGSTFWITRWSDAGGFLGTPISIARATGVVTFESQVLVTAGTKSVCGVAPSGDGDTGMFFPLANTVAFSTGDAERMRIDASGNVGIGLTPTQVFHVGRSGSGIAARFTDNATQTLDLGITASAGVYYDNANSGYHEWRIGGSGKMRIDSSGNVLVGQTTTADPAGANTNGIAIATDYISVSRSSFECLRLNLKAADGTIVALFQDAALEGSISVSGNTVSYNAFAGSHWAQLTDQSRPPILRGTVMETIDEMCDWPDDGGSSDRLVRVRVSDTPASRCVYGVFMAYDEQYASTGDMYVTALGAYMVRVSGVVQSGDLLESAGDGTARTQADDIVRSSTIGKVSSTHRITEYDDGSYLVPCVLMCG